MKHSVVIVRKRKGRGNKRCPHPNRDFNALYFSLGHIESPSQSPLYCITSNGHNYNVLGGHGEDTPLIGMEIGNNPFVVERQVVEAQRELHLTQYNLKKPQRIETNYTRRTKLWLCMLNKFGQNFPTCGLPSKKQIWISTS